MEFIRIPFGYLLEYLYKFTSNYGLSLILFSLIVKLILLPFSAKSKKSMMKMSRLQPQLKQLELACGGTPDEKPEEYARRSAVTYLGSAKEAGVNVMIATGIHDGHTGKGSVPVSQAMRAFNALADEKDRIAEETMNYIDENEKVPQPELFTGHDPFYSGELRAYLKRASGNAQVTIFEGGHGGSSEAGFYWLARQRRGVKADWTLPGGAGDAGYSESAK